MLLPALLILSVLAFVLAGTVVFVSAIGRIVTADAEGAEVRLPLRGRKRLAWNELKPGRLYHVIGIPILVLERKESRFLSNPADFILLVNLPKDEAYLDSVRAGVGLT